MTQEHLGAATVTRKQLSLLIVVMTFGLAVAAQVGAGAQQNGFQPAAITDACSRRMTLLWARRFCTVTA